MNSKEIRRFEALKAAIRAANSSLDNPDPSHQTPITIFKPFQLACESANAELATIAIDCMGKLFTYNYWGRVGEEYDPVTSGETSRKPTPTPSAPHGSHDEIVAAEEDGDNDGTKGSSSGTHNDESIVCTSWRYIAQGDPSDLQRISAFQVKRCPNSVTDSNEISGEMLTGAAIGLADTDEPVPTGPGPLNEKQPDTRTSSATGTPRPGRSNPESAILNSAASNQALKDAFKVFRTLSLLSMKAIPSPEGTMDLRSQPVRSKLLALHLISALLTSHAYVFATSSHVLAVIAAPKATAPPDPSTSITFMDAIKEFMIVNLSRNATSVIPPVFEVSMEIFGKLLMSNRHVLKREISVMFTEIIIPILDSKKSIPWYQRAYLLKSLCKVLGDHNAEGGRALVEIYLNYDCDLEATAKENLFERLISAIAKISMMQGDPGARSTKVQPPQQQQRQAGPSDTVSADDADRKMAKADEIDGAGDGISGNFTRITEADEKTVSRTPSFRGEDDPTAFENLKQRKQLIIEGVKRFNFKPKKGMQFLLDSGCIASKNPSDIAHFLLTTEGLNKAMIGEFLGEGDEENIAIMH
eukprot:jgi/Hompol1/1767/HPOL_005721-RA